LYKSLSAVDATTTIPQAPEFERLALMVAHSTEGDFFEIYGTYNDNISKFATAANGGVMPWWGSNSLATEFASAVQYSLGSPNNHVSPFFGFYLYGTSTLVMCSWSASADDTWPIWCGGVGSHWVVTWAQATTTSVPGPLQLFGVAAALGYSRKLRKRIYRSTKAGSGTDCL
jgi:hypothetical protein